ncbi:hypothetical protein Tco_1081698 [Tanacetum coccineum]|uniref:Uncharacterized protein n=1 Tax=Tanacetum coccineum TaxID=301880 RepID=A0ABQ5HYE7_9ASTR
MRDNADFINNEDDVVAHVLDDDDVEVSDDDEVNPSTNVEEVLSSDDSGSMLRLETGNRSLRKAFRENNEQPLKIGFDYEDLGTFHPLGNFSGMLNSLMGETVRPLPLACEWEEIPEAYKAHIYPTLEAMKDNIKAGLIPFKTDQEILDEIVPSDNRQNLSGMGKEVKGGWLNSEGAQNRAFGRYYWTWDQITQMFRQQEQEKELHRKQAEEAQARAYLALLKANVADQRANVAQQNSEAL